MKNPFSSTRRLLVLPLLALLASCISASNDGASSLWVLDNVSVVDTRTGDIAAHMAVLIDGDTIVRVAPSARLRGAGRRVDGAGAFVVPGYNDMHAHPVQASERAAALTMMLSNGITGFRQMASSPELLAERRAGSLNSPDSPELLVMPGALFVGPVAATPELAIAEVDRQHAEGADFIKMIDVSRPAFFATLTEARRLGMPVAGHLPGSVTPEEAADAGMRAIEHLGPGENLLLSCSSDAEALRREVAAIPRPALTIVPGRVPQEVTERMLANTVLMTVLAGGGASLDRLGRVVDSYSEERCRALAQRFVEHETWQVPTLVRTRQSAFGDDAAYRSDPNLRYVPAPTRRLWEELAQQFSARVTPEQKRAAQAALALQFRVVRLFDEAGVPMLAGSDFGGQWGVAGFSLHQEFDLLNDAGLAPLRVLQMTTLYPARFLGREASMGTVEAGRGANLVLLSADPTAAVANLHAIQGVVRGGRYYSRAELDALQERVALRFAAP